MRTFRRNRMPSKQQSNRRGFMKMLAASPLLAQIAAQGMYEKSAAAIGLDPWGNVYRRLGVKTVINCRGTWTYLSGSLQFPEVQEAQAEASRHFVNMVELHHAVGRRLAELTGAESGLITSDAAGIPPIDNIKLYARMKLDLYTFSGGKGLRGPQCSGVLLGRKDLIEAALRNSCPYEGAVCRPMKVGKEEVIGCLTAIETWLKIDSKKLYDEGSARLDRIAKLGEMVPGSKPKFNIPPDGNRYPTLRISWDQQAWGFNVSECVQKLHDGDPVIEVLSIDNPSMVSAVQEGADKPKPNPKELKEQNHLELVSMTIQPGEEMIVGQRLRAILGAARRGKSA